MKTCLSLLAGLLAGLLTVSEIRGDGIPVNDARTQCVTEHFRLQANDDQKEELVVCGTLTLTSEQWKSARARFPAVPKRISEVLPSSYNDCCCGMEERHWGIWFPDGSVAILGETKTIPFRDLPDESKKNADPNLHFRMDGRGQCYLANSLVPYAEVKDQVANTQGPEEKRSERCLIVEIPPGMNRKDAALASRIDELEKLSKAAGRRFHVLWEKRTRSKPVDG